MKLNELEAVKIVVHNYLIATMCYSTLSLDLENIQKVAKIPEPYTHFLTDRLKQLDVEIGIIREEMSALKINSKIASREIDEYFVEYIIVAANAEYPVSYARAALRNHVSERISDLFTS